MDANCLFCKIVAGQIPANTVFEDETVLAFRDINPQAPTHVLVIPKTHVVSVAEAEKNPQLFGAVVAAAAKVARSEGLEPSGYRLVTNHGQDAGQTVGHLHFHVLGGRSLGWPPG